VEFIDMQKRVEEWHDIIPIKVPLIPSANLLHCPRIPTPLHGVNPRTIINAIDNNWWDRTRKKVYEVSNYKCMCCGVDKSNIKGYPKYLDAHELYSIDYQTGKVKLVYIVALCHTMCHKAIHFGRLTNEFEKGKISDKHFYGVLSHANTLLHENGLPAKDWDVNKNNNVCNVPWENWHLEMEINGEIQRFYSQWKSQEEQDEYYANRTN
jgi:hypothetical protein